MATSSSIVIRWRTDEATDSMVRYGDAPGNLGFTASAPALTTEHEVQLTGLPPATRHYYSVGSSGQALSGGDAGHFFATAPSPGVAKATRVWVLGDSGTAGSGARAVRDAYKSYTGTAVTDLWLMLGDNAYPDGTDQEYQAAVFDMYPETLRQAPLWPTLGNHDGHTADSATQTGAYYEIFTLPTNGEAGGLASGTEAYYSFDYGNIHFVCLESYETDRSPSGAMMTWLEFDLAANDKDWTIAFWHHPPYSKGSHNGMRDMREIANPILESYGVNIVLSGHSHSYERSHLLDGHYGAPDTLTSAMILDGGGGREDGNGAYTKTAGAANDGVVYTVAGSSGSVSSSGTLDHPAMFISLRSLGSVVLEINGNRLDATFLDAGGSVGDYFTIINGPDTTAPSLIMAEAAEASSVRVSLSEALDAASVETAANYAIDNGVDVITAILSADGKSVVLDTSPLVEGVAHTLTVNNVTDLAGNPVAANSQTEFTFVTVQSKAFRDGVAPSSGYAGTRDAYISENAPDSAFGGATVLLVDGAPSDYSTLLLWDLSDIPSNALVEGATITINVTDISNDIYEFYEMKADWQEDGATWNSYAPGSPWAVPGAFGALDRGAAVLGTVNAGSLGSHTITLNQQGLDLMQAWVDGSVPNFGFIIADGEETNGLDFSSREAGAPLDRPMLTVTYSLPPASADVEPPSPPRDLQLVSKTEATVSLDWKPCADYHVLPCDDDGVAGHKIYRDGQIVGTPTAPSFEDTGLVADTAYSYAVSSYDAANNESLLSAALDVITDPAFSYSCTALTCVFTDGHRSAVSWLWDFGDGNFSSVQDPTHSYAAGGTYTVTLTTTDNAGASESTSQGVTVSESASMGMHVGDIDGSKGKNKNRWRARVNIAVHDTNHSPVSGAIVTYSWSSRDVSGSGVCTTDGAGQCPSDWTPYLLKQNKSVTFAVDSVAHSLEHRPADNHDPDDDSDGTAITVVKGHKH